MGEQCAKLLNFSDKFCPRGSLHDNTMETDSSTFSPILVFPILHATSSFDLRFDASFRAAEKIVVTIKKEADNDAPSNGDILLLPFLSLWLPLMILLTGCLIHVFNRKWIYIGHQTNWGAGLGACSSAISIRFILSSNVLYRNKPSPCHNSSETSHPWKVTTFQQVSVTR